jgi:hypothetical protein
MVNCSSELKIGSSLYYDGQQDGARIRYPNVNPRNFRLKASSNMLVDTLPLMSRLVALLPTAKAGTVTFISP